MGPPRSIRDVAEKHLCTGCGVCSYLFPDALRMVDDLDHGRRPLQAPGAAPVAGEALEACPGVGLTHEHDPADPDLVLELERHWGPVRGVFEGHAADDEVRWKGSSGGAATALALFALEEAGFSGVLHVAAREDVPWLNRTVLSTTRRELVERSGSRYAPASPCDGLERVESAPAPCVFVGKPCDVAGARAAAHQRPALADKLGLTIGIFCAGAPSSRGTLELLAAAGVEDPERVREVRYRGEGWPGRARVRALGADGRERDATFSYQESWGRILQKHRQWRCYVCADHTGEFADIAVGDPWYRAIPEGEPGRSLVLARTPRGAAFLARAIAAGALVAQPVEPEVLVASQPNLLKTRGAAWGRSRALRLLGLAAPRHRGLATFSAWRGHLSWRERLQTFCGTWKRVVFKGLWRRAPVVPYEASPAQAPEPSVSPAQGETRRAARAAGGPR